MTLSKGKQYETLKDGGRGFYLFCDLIMQIAELLRKGEIVKFNFGKEGMRQNRTIMLLGATGSGKSTLINGMINYIVGVEWNDHFRFKLIDEDQSKSQAHSQTSEVTVYKINHQDGFKTPFSLTVVDTPGFGDTRGVARDKEITEQIRRLFTSINGVSELDAVCFVTQASLARLTATQRYVFDSVLSIFGKDVAENIQMLVTFADGKQPPVLEAINIAEVPCPKNDLGFPVHFKFNNSALFADNQGHGLGGEDSDEEDNFDEMFWKMGIKSMEKFFTALGKMKTKSLLMTQEVLKERKHLETAIEGLQPQVKAGLAKLEEIKTTQQKIKDHETVMTSNENFEIEVDVTKPVQIQITEKGAYITNCQICSTTCHYPCAIANDNEKRGCASMDGAGMCTVCPGKCIWRVHFNQTYRWEYVKVKEKQTLKELKHKYEKASQEKMTIQELIQRQEEEIGHLQDVMVGLMDRSAQSITRLQEISLRPNPLTTPEYIDMMIQGEESEAKEGYQARIQSLEAVKERATLISKVAKRDKRKISEEKFSEETQERKKPKGFFEKITNFFGLSG
uniref:AIG1-type G domain-containing protein n=1 Tax=Acanthochromis polyacanthus TaxID=80966 RepID=A0A3Q1F9M7_9TELE